MRRAFMLRLRPGALEEYRRHHRGVWPELEREIEAAGIVGFSIFERDPVLVVSSEVADDGAWRRLWESPVHRRWAELMEPLLMLDDDGLPESVELPEVYRYPPGD